MKRHYKIALLSIVKKDLIEFIAVAQFAVNQTNSFNG